MSAPLFAKVLVANRGEIAIRVFRTLRELGIASVAIYSEADRDALHVSFADEAFLVGPAPAAESYLDIASVIGAAREAGAKAIHPGYGFLAENAAFARACQEAGITFIGPSPEAIDAMGSKTASRELMRAAGVPVVPGTTQGLASLDEARSVAAEVGYPVALKASAGGGGKGFRVAMTPDELEAAYDGASREGEKYFGDGEVYVERYLVDPRHVEVQVLGDTHGTVLHLHERDCSIQRRHQKLIEECPSPALDDSERERLFTIATDAARAVGYTSAGTVECLYAAGEVYFLEMNTRVQVEHTVTEAVTGIDIVAEQVRIAAGQPISFSQQDVTVRGHAIECRINAEDPWHDFRPSSGPVTRLVEPAGIGVRVDSGVRQGGEISPWYDSMVAKLITVGRDREEARRRMLRALDEYVVEGVETLIPFHSALLADAEFVAAGTCRTQTQDPAGFLGPKPGDSASAANGSQPATELTESGTRVVEVNGRRYEVRLFTHTTPASHRARRAGGRRRAGSSTAVAAGDVVAPIPGNVLQVRVAEGDTVTRGQVLCVLEAMKMENEIASPVDGTVSSVLVEPGTAVAGGQKLLHVEPAG